MYRVQKGRNRQPVRSEDPFNEAMETSEDEIRDHSPPNAGDVLPNAIGV